MHSPITQSSHPHQGHAHVSKRYDVQGVDTQDHSSRLARSIKRACHPSSPPSAPASRRAQAHQESATSNSGKANSQPNIVKSKNRQANSQQVYRDAEIKQSDSNASSFHRPWRTAPMLSTEMRKAESVHELKHICDTYHDVLDAICLSTVMSRLGVFSQLARDSHGQSSADGGNTELDQPEMVSIMSLSDFLVARAVEMGPTKFTLDSGSSFLWGLAKVGYKFGRSHSELTDGNTSEENPFTLAIQGLIEGLGSIVADSVVNNNDERATRSLISSVWAIAKIGGAEIPANAKIWPKLLQQVCVRLKELGCRELSNVMWAMATANIYNSMVWDTLSSRMVILIPREMANTLDIQNMMWAAARLGHRDDDLIQVVVRMCTPQLLQSMDRQGLSNMVWAIDRLKLDEPELLRNLLQRIEGESLNSYGTNQLVMLVYTLVKQKAASARFLREVAPIIAHRAPTLKYFEVSTIAWSYARADQQIMQQLSSERGQWHTPPLEKPIGSSSGSSKSDRVKMMASPHPAYQTGSTQSSGWGSGQQNPSWAARPYPGYQLGSTQRTGWESEQHNPSWAARPYPAYQLGSTQRSGWGTGQQGQSWGGGQQQRARDFHTSWLVISAEDERRWPETISSLFAVLSMRVVELSDSFVSMRAVGTLFWSFSSVGEYSKEAFEALCVGPFKRHVQTMSPTLLAMSLWALATSGHKPPEHLLRDAALSVASIMDKFKARELSNVLWSFAELGHYSFDLFGSASKHLLEPSTKNLQRSSSKGSIHFGKLMKTATSSQAKASAAGRDERAEASAPGWGETYSRADQKAEPSTSGASSSLYYKEPKVGTKIPSWGKLRRTLKGRLKLGERRTRSQQMAWTLLQMMNPQEVGKVAWSFAKVGHVDEELFAHIGDIISLASGTDHTGDTGTVSRSLWAFTMLGQYDEGLYDKLTHRALVDAESLQPRDTARLLWSIAASGHAAADELVEYCLLHATNNVANYSPPEMGDVAWASAVLHKSGRMTYRPNFLKFACSRLNQNYSMHSFEDVSNIMWSLMVFRQLETDTCQLVCSRAVSQVRTMQEQALLVQQYESQQYEEGDAGNAMDASTPPAYPPTTHLVDLMHGLVSFSYYHRMMYTLAAESLTAMAYHLDMEKVVLCIWIFSISLPWTVAESRTAAQLNVEATPAQVYKKPPTPPQEADRSGANKKRWLYRQKQKEKRARHERVTLSKTEERTIRRRKKLLEKHGGDENAVHIARMFRENQAIKAHSALIKELSLILEQAAPEPSRLTKPEMQMLWQAHVTLQDWVKREGRSEEVSTSPLYLKPSILNAARKSCIGQAPKPGRKRLLIEVSMLMGELGYRASMSTGAGDSTAVLGGQGSTTTIPGAEENVLADPDIISARLEQQYSTSGTLDRSHLDNRRGSEGGTPSMGQNAGAGAAQEVGPTWPKVAILLASDEHLTQTKDNLLVEAETKLELLHRCGWRVVVLQLVDWGRLYSKEAKLGYMRKQLQKQLFPTPEP